MGLRHLLRHDAAHAAQGFGRLDLGQHLGDATHVVGGDLSLGAARVHRAQIDVQLAGQGADGGRHLDLGAAGPRRLGPLVDAHLVARHGADHGAGVGSLTLIEVDQGRPHRHDVARLGVQLGDASGMGRRYLDDRLVGLHRQQRLLVDHLIADGDVPVDDLGFLEALPQVGQVEPFHAKATAPRAASKMRASLGRKASSSLGRGGTTS